MKAVVLAAGKGTRLRPLTDELPKVMIPINGKPVLEYHIMQLAKAGVRDVFINLNYLPGKITDYFNSGKRWDMKINYSWESTILGTAGAVNNLKNDLKAGPFLVIYGDNYLDIDYKDFIRCSEKNGGVGSVVVFWKENVYGTGILDFANDMRVKRFKEKPAQSEVFSHWVNAGVFYFNESIFNFISPGFSDFGHDVLPRILEKKEKIFAYKLKNKVWGIDSFELLSELEAELKKRESRKL